MNLTQFALSYRQTTILIIVLICICGFLAYKDMPKAQDPGFKIRTAQIITQLPGASAKRIEQLITDKIEKKVQEMPELDSVTSQSKTGISIINVNIKESYSDLRPIWDKLRRKVEAVRSELPADASAPDVNDDFGDVYGIVVSMVADGFSYAESKDYADLVRDHLLRLPLAAKVSIHGAQSEHIFIEYNNARLLELGLSPAYISSFLKNKNIIQSGGELTAHDDIIAIEPSGDINSVQMLRETYIPLPGNSISLPLGDIANIYRSYASPPRSLVHTNGQPSLILSVSMVDGGNIITLGEAVKQQLAELEGAIPWGIQFEVVYFQPDMVVSTIDTFISNLLQAIAVVSLAMILTLGARTGLVVASLIPVTILASIAVMSVLGIGLDQVSLAALMIALGMLVDNAIVMSESVMKKMELGVSKVDAALQSASELRIPLLTSSLTTSAAFLPIFLAESTTGEYTASIFKVVTIALLISWVLALTLIPLLGILFLTVKQGVKEDGFFAKVEERYAALLRVMLNNKVSVLTGVLLVFTLAVWSIRFVPSLFFPPSEDPTFKMEIELPVGSSISRTEHTVANIEKYLKTLLGSEDHQGLSNWVAYIGNGGPRYVLSHSSKPAAPNYAFILLNTYKGESVDKLIRKLDSYLFENYPDATFSVKRLATGAPVHHPIEVRISGDNQAALLRIRDQVRLFLGQFSGLKNISDDWGLLTKKLFVNIDEAKASTVSVTNADIAQALRASVSGIKVGEFRERDQTLPIIFKSETVLLDGVPIPSSINVFSQSGQAIPLGQTASIELAWEAPVIYRKDRMLTASVYADLEPQMTAAQVNKILGEWLEEQKSTWPEGFSWEFGGEAETSGSANNSIGEKLPIACMIIVLLLMLQFNNFRRTAIILLVIPLGLIGVIGGLLVARSYMGFMTLLGIISLAGIVINNAIVLIDRILIEERENQRAITDAIICAGRHRLRPILLTTATTVLGMIPLWLGGGAMWEPMAIAIIFGLLGATILTLGIVPVIYSLLFREMHR